MIQQRISSVSQNNDLRLHHVPFLLLWVGSYGLIWLWIYIYENLVYSQLWDFYLWLKGGYGNAATWRVDLLFGLLVGITLAGIHSWLLKRRYGYIPKYWGIATIIGATVGGLGYHPLGSSVGGSTIWTNEQILFWFGCMNIFQVMIVMRGYRRGWLIGLVGILSACFTIVLLALNGQILYFQRLGLIVSTGIQALGTGIAILYIMVKPVQNDDDAKHIFSDRISSLTFMILWILVFYIAQSVMLLFDQWTRIAIYPQLRFWFPDSYGVVFQLLYFFVSITLLGIVLGFAQQWIIKQYTGRIIYHWQWVTGLGWATVGLIQIVLYNFSWSFDENTVWVFAWLVIPSVFQSFLMMRTVNLGVMWSGTGMLAWLIYALVIGHSLIPNLNEPHRLIFVAGFILSIISAGMFLWLTSRSIITIDQESWDASTRYT